MAWIRKIKIIFEIYNVTRWEANNFIVHIAQNLKKQRNQTMKIGQIIDYNRKNIFLKKSCTKCGGKTIFRHFSKKAKIEHISGGIIKLVFIVCQAEGYRNIWKLSCRLLALPHKKLFENTKRCLELVSAWFFFKNISLVIFY